MDEDLTRQGRGVRWMRTMQQVQEMESSATSTMVGKRSAAATAMAKAVLRQSQADEAKREKHRPNGQRLEGDEVRMIQRTDQTKMCRRRGRMGG